MYHQISLDRIDRNYQTDKTSPTTYNQPGLHQPLGDFTMPMGFADIPQFETLNNVQVNVFGYDNGQFFPLKISSYSSDFVMDLLLLYDCDRHHYVLITNLVKVVCYVRGLDYRFSYKICRNFLLICREGLESYNLHLNNCCKNAPAVIHMPSSENNSYKFTNLAATWFVPLVIYFDFESFLRPVSSCKGPSDKAFTQVKEIHEPCGFALTVIDHHSSKPIFHHVDSSPACMTNFVKMLHKLARDIHQQKRKHPFFKGDRRNLGKSNATHCWICEKSFSETEDPENTIDLDHCHYSAKFLGWEHEKCNRLRRNINFTPVVGHNIQNYDLHHNCLALNNCEPTTTISVIPATDEKYISMTFGVLIDTFVTEKGKTVKVYEYLRFIDSFKMMNSSLEKLVEILPDDRFEIMRAMFSTLSDANLQLLKQKGYYPYSYVTSRSKFSDTSLPPLSKWGNTLDGGAVKVTETNLQHARRMWEILECGTLQDYHYSYLKLDCALLAYVCEFHRQLSFDTYKLDCMHFFTLPNMAKEASLRICKANVELLTERENLDMIEPAIRGGVTSVFESRRFTANNSYIPNHDSTEESCFGFCVDADNLYGGVMQLEKLPLADFAFNTDIQLQEILDTADDASIGYFVEVDISYPPSLHDEHRDFPLAPTKDVVEDEWLSDYQIELKEQHNLPSSKVKKLLQTFFDKERYVVHYKLLKLYVQLGLVIRKQNWLSPYITLNSEKRQVASNKFEENFDKLMNNAVYGKNCESKRRRNKITISRNAEHALKIISRFEFDRYMIFGENLAALTTRPKTIYWNTRTIVGATILDLAKFHMYSFHYNVMRPHFNCRLLYSDTDSLLYAIKSDDFYTELSQKPQSVLSHFDFSNYPPNHFLYDTTNKRVVLKYKDEFAGDYITDFICLKPKLYSILSKSKFILS